MPFNLLTRYNHHLELASFSQSERTRSLKGVFNRDFVDLPRPTFLGKPIYPAPIEGMERMEILFTHLTTCIADKQTRRREFEMKRSVRLHWARHHLNGMKTDRMLIFSVKEPEGNRTYIYDQSERYVVILEPLRSRDAYYLLTAYYVEGKDLQRNKFEQKWKRKLPQVL